VYESFIDCSRKRLGCVNTTSNAAGRFGVGGYVCIWITTEWQSVMLKMC
jgi:hypothetical protein